MKERGKEHRPLRGNPHALPLSGTECRWPSLSPTQFGGVSLCAESSESTAILAILVARRARAVAVRRICPNSPPRSSGLRRSTEPPPALVKFDGTTKDGNLSSRSTSNPRRQSHPADVDQPKYHARDGARLRRGGRQHLLTTNRC